MKLKKVLASVLAATMTASMMILPASAATVTHTLTPSTSGKKYALQVTMTAETMGIKYTSGDSGTISGGAEGSKGTLKSNGKSQSVTVNSATLNNAKITSSAFTFGISTATNRLVAGTVSKYTWVGTLYFSDRSKHPVSDLGLSTSDIELPVSLTLNSSNDNISNAGVDMVFSSAKVIDEASDVTFDTSKVIPVKTYVNSGKGFTIAQRDKFKTGKNFKMTLNFAKAVDTFALITVETDSTDDKKSVVANNKDTSATFDIDQKFFYDVQTAKDYGVDTTFTELKITDSQSLGITSIVISFDEGTADTSTDTSTNTDTDTSTDTDSDAAEEEFYMNFSALTLNKDVDFYLTTSYDEVKWSTSDRNIVRVFTSGKIKTVKAGTATIYARNTDGERISCKVTVVDSATPSTSFSLKTTKGTVYVGSSYDLSSKTISPTNSTDKITWSTSDPSVATVSSAGKVSVKGTGSATITAVTSSGLTATCVLTAKNPTVSLTSSSGSVNVGSTVAIKATAKPSSSKLTYESLNENIATVSSTGVVTGVKAGTAKIEVVSNKGIVKIYTVTVK